MDSVGILGGTFDPVHHGHLITALSILEKRELDKIIFIPCYISPHKQEQKSSKGEDRLNMLNSALENIEMFETSDYELKKGGVSYTYDTLLELNKKYRHMELIIGFDNLIDFDTWKNPEGILNLAKVLVMSRKVDDKSIQMNEYFNNTIFVETSTIEISSTEIRERVKRGLPIDFFVPQTVRDYIINHHLYSG